jgi:flagellar biosynthesis chaperone FliJ
VSRTTRLRRLCEIRRVEEQMQASLLDSANAELLQIDTALEEAHIRKRTGQVLARTGIQTGRAGDRVMGFEEIACATRVSQFLLTRKALAEERVEKIREEYLRKRAEKCQLESLLRKEAEREMAAIQRRSQSALDEWYRGLRYGRSLDAAEDKCSADMKSL